LNGCSGFLFFGYGIAVMPRKLNQYSPDFVFMQAILKALNQGQKEQSEPRTSRENFCRANRANQVPDGIVRSAELEAVRGQRLYREARIKKMPKRFASTSRASKFLLCKLKGQEIRPKNL
jgi:hypothetical protein